MNPPRSGDRANCGHTSCCLGTPCNGRDSRERPAFTVMKGGSGYRSVTRAGGRRVHYKAYATARHDAYRLLTTSATAEVPSHVRWSRVLAPRVQRALAPYR